MTDWHKLLIYYIDHVIAHESISFIDSTMIGTGLVHDLSEEEMNALRQAEDEARALAKRLYRQRVEEA